MHFPDEGAGGKCNKEFWSKWIPRRIKHNAFVLSLWACIWLLGTYPLGRPLSEGWRFMFTVSFFARIGYSAAWMFITNFTHSLPWNEFLAQDPGRTWPVLHNVMAMVLGGKHRWNEMLFHDVHHAFPNAVGTLSQRGRFHGWEKVHDAAAEVLHRGLWKPNGDEDTQMQKTQKKRSMMMQQGKKEPGQEARKVPGSTLVWENAVRLSMKHAPERYSEIVSIVSKRLKLIQRFEAAAELYESIDAFREAVNCYIAGEVWDKARQLAQQHCPDMVRVVEDRYKSDLVGKGDGDELIRRTGDVDSALDMYARNGDWTKCLALAEKHSPKMLPHYLVQYCKVLVNRQEVTEAAQMLVRYGPPPEQSNFQLYKHIHTELLAKPDATGPPLVREMLLRVTMPPGTLGAPPTPKILSEDRRPQAEFLKALLTAHLQTVRERLRERNMAPEVVAKISVALCRYCAEFPLDLAFYDAGIDCKNAGMINMSFFFLNRFLDIADAIEDPDNAAIDNTDFMETDIPSPYDLDLPEQAHISNDKAGKIRDWVLGWSMDQNVQQKMDLRPCDKCGAHIYTGAATCPHCGTVSEPCIISGFPVLKKTRVECTVCHSAANRDDWNIWVQMFKECPWNCKIAAVTTCFANDRISQWSYYLSFLFRVHSYWLSKGAEEKRWCGMADSPGPDPQEGEDVDDGDFPFLKADHPAYKRLQEAWRKQLTGHNDRVTLQLREKQEELKKLVKHREDIGVTLYGAQQQLAKLQLQLEQLHDKYAMDDEKLKNVTSDWEGKKVEVEEATRRLANWQDELNQLNITVRQVQEYNEQMKAEIQVTRRATYKAEDHIKQIEEMKSKQDLLIDSMNEDIKRLTERKALLDAQISAQRQETEAAMATLREASREMEAIEFEKKQLMMQWRSSLVGMQRRDEALQNVQKALEEQSEAELAIENEIRGLHSSIRTEQERHEQLCALRDRNDKEMQYLQSQMTSLKQEREKLMDQYSTLNKSMDQHLEETQKLKAAITEQTRSMEVLERNMQNVSREITAMVGKIEEEQSEQTTCERVTANSRKRMKKIREEIAAKEVETQNLLNEIARVTVDSLNTKAHNQMLKDRHKQLSDELADREKLIEQYEPCEQEIRKRHHQIEKKQLFVDRLNREYDEKRTKLEAELGNDEDVAGPQEAKLKHMRKAINELTKECSEMQKDWIQKQTQLLSISSETDKLKATLNENKNKKMVLEQKKLRIEGQLSSHEKEIKELENNMKHLRFDMDRMNSALVKNEARSGEISNTNQMMETEFVQKLKEIENRLILLTLAALPVLSCLCLFVGQVSGHGRLVQCRTRKSILHSAAAEERDVEKLKLEKDQMNQDILESERQVLLWERKITLEREMQAALDPNVGQSDAAAMKKEIHRMELRLEQLKRRQEQTIVEMERAIHKRDAIALKLEPKAQKTKKAASAANVKRQLQSLRNNLKLCTQANSDAEQKISERQRDLAELQQTIEQAAQEYGNLERAGEALRAEVQVGHVEKQQNLASILQLQRTAKRLDDSNTMSNCSSVGRSKKSSGCLAKPILSLKICGLPSTRGWKSQAEDGFRSDHHQELETKIAGCTDPRLSPKARVPKRLLSKPSHF
eukprot:s5846_g1.t1